MALFLLILSAFIAGIINAIAGGGSFLTFPALIAAGVPAVAANATSTVALLPGSFASAISYRKQARDLPGLSVRALLLVSLAGGVAGSVLLLRTPEKAFVELAPWLLVFATVLFTFGTPISAFLKARVHIGATSVLAMQGIIAIYGGYFGGGIGIMMLAALSLYGVTNVNAMNALKTLLSGSLNAIAALIFVCSGLIHWHEAVVMAIASIAGGYFGAHMAQRVHQRIVRTAVIAIACSMTAYLFIHASR